MEHPLPPNPKILVRGVNWLGDAVMSAPALQRLREAKPSARISLLTHRKLADLWQGHSAVDEVIPFEAGESPWSVGARLKAMRFDAGLVFPNSPRSALELFLARIPRRIGYGGGLRSCLLTQWVPPHAGRVGMKKRTPREINALIREQSHRKFSAPPTAHHIHHYLAIVAALGANPAPLEPTLTVRENEVAAFLSRFEIKADAPLIGLNAGAEYGAAKRWPEDRFVGAALAVNKARPMQFVVFGGSADGPLAARVTQAVQNGGGRAVSVAGRTSLRELCAGLKACQVVLTNDTGPMHVAAAVGTRVVVPFGSTSPELTGPGLPGGNRHRLLVTTAPCSPCFLRECPIDFRCLNGIPAADAARAILELLSTPERV